MARVWIPLAAAELAALPEVCALTGQPADQPQAVPARARAGWTWWLLPLGVVPFLVARHFAPEVTIRVPLAAAVVRRIDRLRMVCLLVLVEAVALVAAALVVDRRDVLVAGIACLAAAGLVQALVAACSVRATLDPSARGILLSGVHTVFRDEFDRRQRAAWTHATGPRPRWPSGV
jgi:hypothetical protein